MAWQDTLLSLRDELADVRARRLERAKAEEAELSTARQEMVELSGSLEVSRLLSDINATLLGGLGEVQTIISWDQDNEEEDSESQILDDMGLDAADEDEEAVTSLLSWDEDGDREIAVEVILDEEGISLQVNGVEIRPKLEALEQALLEAFRDELEL